MSKKFKAPKDHVSLLAVWHRLPVIDRCILFVPVVVAVVLAAWLAFGSNPNSTSSAQSSRELIFTTDGYWDTFDDYNFDVWVPKDPTAEAIEDDSATYQKLHASRDKGGSLDLGFGVIAVPDADGDNYDVSADISNIISVSTPYLSSALDLSTGGIQSTFSVDNSITTLSTGDQVVVGQGTSTTMVMYQDPSDAAETWSEELTLNLYYMITIFYNRPVIVWGVWGDSVYEGENRVIAAVSDAAVSLVPTEGEEVVPASGDYSDSQENVFASAGQTTTWDAEKQAWIDDATGEVVDMPPPDDPYWDDKQTDPTGTIKYGYEDPLYGWVETDENGTVLDSNFGENADYGTDEIPETDIVLPDY